MTNQEILTKAIQKAIDGGWDLYEFMECPGEPTQWKVYGNGVIQVPFARGGGNMKVLGDYIFNHDFAKALWGEGDVLMDIQRVPMAHPIYTDAETLSGFTLPHWQYNLMQMVIADDPIKYLEENI